MDLLIEDLYNSIATESGLESHNLNDEIRLKDGIKDIAHSIFNIREGQQADLDTFFIGLAETPMLSGLQNHEKHHNIFNKKDITSFNHSEPNNIVTTIAELGNSINLKEKKLVEDIVNSGMDKKIVTKLDLDISFESRFKKTFKVCDDTNDHTLETLISQLSQNNSKLQVDIKDGDVNKIFNEILRVDAQGFQETATLKAFLNLPTLVQECNENELYQEALFLQQVYINNMHRFKSYLITQAKSNTFGLELLDSIRHHINNVIKTDMVDSLEETILKSDDFVTLKRVVDTLVKINQDDLKSLETFINARTKKLEKFFNDNIGEINIIDKIDYFRTELFNIINIYQLTFGSNDSMRNLPSECFVKEYLIPLKVNADVESATIKPQFTNVIMMKMLKDFLNLLLKKEDFTSKKLDKNCLLQLIYCAYRLKESNENYFNILLNRLVETDIYTEEEILRAIEKRKELSRMLSL
ncbi:uncharacterized protein HGUI_03248 [Hanseniaspora guilliermondii]|uniref:Uncharacterized protein n=1 Tax=Hanseniaspora guilliermondii TaxID=56406 RepID=A0A1L0B3I4_9ASCO|nr:uncharacterized protein HGUI_03248 [Hanseniaspora guilliermondii]